MPFPYGGKATYSDLAKKFGWPTVIISPFLLPFTFLFTNVLAYPFFIARKWKYFQRQYSWYLEGGEDIWRQKMYLNKENLMGCGCIPGWNCYVDKEGGKFYESIWGLMNCLDATVNEDSVTFTPNSFSWVITKVFAEFPKPPVTGHRIRFYFAIDGINQYNPFAWMNVMFCFTGIIWMGKYGVPKFKAIYPVETEQKAFPEENDPADRVMPYTDPRKKADNYGSIS